MDLFRERNNEEGSPRWPNRGVPAQPSSIRDQWRRVLNVLELHGAQCLGERTVLDLDRSRGIPETKLGIGLSGS